MKKKKDFISITDLSAKEIWQVLLMAKKLKQKIADYFAGKTMVMLFGYHQMVRVGHNQFWGYGCSDGDAQ